MAKKKTKSAPKSKPSSHGQLFDSHPNLKWLLPVFFVIAAVAILAMKNNTDAGTSTNMTTSVDQSTLNATDSGTQNTSDSTSGY
jgi:hypothetical protein